ncbi:hypothetical protein H696_04560 [Fonticula alba]|uniref:G-patch domain-containing protein n=1 Tax=Fonticula alba TaxID=691883 RepID=A0A058Z4F1_FONAL|nr:hypothetical protein H696_04560 [Fonticula alba]KCV69145.1 hypothetical protein H696_04560 [Fonticula alba]|eukprot:XP_009496716.1 hypothetical protein H696_04560 [Fonticula alba]
MSGWSGDRDADAEFARKRREINRDAAAYGSFFSLGGADSDSDEESAAFVGFEGARQGGGRTSKSPGLGLQSGSGPTLDGSMMMFVSAGIVGGQKPEAAADTNNTEQIALSDEDSDGTSSSAPAAAAAATPATGRSEYSSSMGRRKPTRPAVQQPLSRDFASFERHTKGIGMKLLLQMGFQPGRGLGKHGQGLVEPIKAVVRDPQAGLTIDGGEGPGSRGQRTRRGRSASRRGAAASSSSSGSESDSESGAASLSGSDESDMSDVEDAPRGPARPRPPKLVFRTLEEIRAAEAPALSVEEVLRAGPGSAAALAGDLPDGHTRYHAGMAFPEIRHNVALLVEHDYESLQEATDHLERARAGALRGRRVATQCQAQRERLARRASALQRLADHVARLATAVGHFHRDFVELLRHWPDQSAEGLAGALPVLGGDPTSPPGLALSYPPEAGFPAAPASALEQLLFFCQSLDRVFGVTSGAPSPTQPGKQAALLRALLMRYGLPVDARSLAGLADPVAFVAELFGRYLVEEVAELDRLAEAAQVLDEHPVAGGLSEITAELAAAAALPYFAQRMAAGAEGWALPLVDSHRDHAALATWRPLLRQPVPSSGASASTGALPAMRTAGPPGSYFDLIVWEHWLPTVRSAIINEWNPTCTVSTKLMSDFIEVWCSSQPDLLPPTLQVHLLTRLVLPRVEEACRSWRPGSALNRPGGPMAGAAASHAGMAHVLRSLTGRDRFAGLSPGRQAEVFDLLERRDALPELGAASTGWVALWGPVFGAELFASVEAIRRRVIDLLAGPGAASVPLTDWRTFAALLVAQWGHLLPLGPAERGPTGEAILRVAPADPACTLVSPDHARQLALASVYPKLAHLAGVGPGSASPPAAFHHIKRLVIDPSGQNTGPLRILIAFGTVLPATAYLRLWTHGVLPQWMTVLDEWLAHVATEAAREDGLAAARALFRQILQWVAAWRGALPAALVSTPALVEHFVQAYDKIEASMQVIGL